MTLNKQILDEASDWFVDFRVGDVDAAGRERFDYWVRRSPEHIRAYIEIAKLYVDLPAVEAAGAVNVAALINLARATGNVVPFETAADVPAKNDRPRPPVWGRALAASILVACIAVGASLWLLPHGYDLYSTQIGERRLITLVDGSTIDLNARSKIRVRLSADAREVELLAGQALFEVAKDKTRPFIVRSDRVVVRAVGTQFDVNCTRKATTVTVIEGRVAVGADSGNVANTPGLPAEKAVAPSVFLDAGEQIIFTDRGRSAPEPAKISAATAWVHHRAVFDSARLSDVVDEFNRYNTRQLVIEDRQLEDMHISGVYSSTDPVSLLRFLRAQPGVNIYVSDTEVRITSR